MHHLIENRERSPCVHSTVFSLRSAVRTPHCGATAMRKHLHPSRDFSVYIGHSANHMPIKPKLHSDAFLAGAVA
jgi:hypothetical protein